MTHTFVAEADHEGDWWALYVPELDIATQCKTLEQAPATLRDLISVWMRIPENQIALKIHEVKR